VPDISCEYVLSTPAGTITFNSGLADQYFITDIPQGLSGAPISAPIDPVAYGTGSRSYNWWQRGRHILIEGNFFVTSQPLCSPEIVAAWNVMEEDLRAKLASCAGLDSAVATLTWTPSGLSQRTLEVRNDVELECPPDQNYLVRTFHFGLFTDAILWT